MADPRDEDLSQTEGGDARRVSQGGLEPPGFGRGYGRDFGGGGLNQGADGSWGQGYGASADPPHATPEDFGDDRSWMDRCADEECAGRGPHRGRGPQSWAPDDRRVWEIVCERLMHDRLIDAREMEVEVENGVVTLRGVAAHASDPALARMLVRQTPGVRDVVTELRIETRQRSARAELGSRTSGYAANMASGQADEDGRRQGPWASPSGAA